MSEALNMRQSNALLPPFCFVRWCVGCVTVVPNILWSTNTNATVYHRESEGTFGLQFHTDRTCIFHIQGTVPMHHADLSNTQAMSWQVPRMKGQARARNSTSEIRLNCCVGVPNQLDNMQRRGIVKKLDSGPLSSWVTRQVWRQWILQCQWSKCSDPTEPIHHWYILQSQALHHIFRG